MRKVHTEWDLNFELGIIKRDFRYLRSHYEGGDYENHDLVKKAKNLRQRLLKFQTKRSNKLAKELQKVISISMVCGEHWREVETDNRGCFNWIKNHTTFSHNVKVKEVELDLVSDDYCIIDFYVNYPEPHSNVHVNVNKLMAIM